MRQAGAVEGYEVRYMVQSDKYRRGGLIVRAPNADLGSDPRWGRTEVCCGEEPFFNGAMVVSSIKGLQGDHSKFWTTCSMKSPTSQNTARTGTTTSPG
jgi:beta-glucosidase